MIDSMNEYSMRCSTSLVAMQVSSKAMSRPRSGTGEMSSGGRRSLTTPAAARMAIGRAGCFRVHPHETVLAITGFKGSLYRSVDRVAIVTVQHGHTTGANLRRAAPSRLRHLPRATLHSAECRTR